VESVLVAPRTMFPRFEFFGVRFGIFRGRVVDLTTFAALQSDFDRHLFSLVAGAEAPVKLSGSIIR
jgi:hypothetical protein